MMVRRWLHRCLALAAALVLAVAQPLAVRADFGVTNLIGFGVGGNAAPVVVEYVGTGNSSTANASSYTFTAEPIGTAASDRLVAVLVSTSGGINITINSITYDGAGGTQVVANASGQADGAIFSKAMPTGTTSTLVITLSGNADRIAIFVVAITGLQSQTAAATAALQVNAADGASVAATLDIPAGGVALFAHAHKGTNLTTWSSAAEKYDTALEGSAVHSFAGLETAALLSAHTETASWTGNQIRGIAAASWR